MWVLIDMQLYKVIVIVNIDTLDQKECFDVYFFNFW